MTLLLGIALGEECERCHGAGYIYISHACPPPEQHCEACDYEDGCAACETRGAFCAECGRPCGDECERCFPEYDGPDTIEEMRGEK